jgi:hypothetical protein
MDTASSQTDGEHKQIENTTREDVNNSDTVDPCVDYQFYLHG